MDLNVQPPRSWDSLDGPYEIADYCLSQRSDTLILLNAWLESFDEDHDESALGTLNFWAQRLRPLWIDEDEDDDSATGHAQTNVVICNRTGEENGT
jgi:protein N-terminal amidase